MAEQRFTSFAQGRTAGSAEIDEGLRSFMLKVYNYMGLGLALTGAVAFFVSTSPALMQAIFGTPLQWLVMLSPFAFILVLSFGINRLRPATAQLLFWAFAGVMGLSLSSIFIVYTGTSVARVFFITASVFGAMSLYGYTTKKSLASWGSFLFMGLVGILIAMVVNLFLASSALHFIISVVGVLVFTGLTAYDTQQIKHQYYEGDTAVIAEKKAIMGALRLYLDFINLFIMLMHLLGQNR
ncbi:MAG: Bax inhibitor-1/YccA family protein [Pseudomonadota bacterium]|nr:Bax inhibitor-1/YccA family protein [Pseudomonadota bacterium]